MSRFANFASIAAILSCSAAFTAAAQQQSFPQHLFFRVTLGPQFSSPVSGRLLLFVSRRARRQSSRHRHDGAHQNLRCGQRGFRSCARANRKRGCRRHRLPRTAFERTPPGTTKCKRCSMSGIPTTIPGARQAIWRVMLTALPAWNPQQQLPPALTLTMTVPEPPDPLSNATDLLSALEPVDFRSTVLSRFWGRDIHMKAWVLLPPGYRSHPGTALSDGLLHPRFWRHSALLAQPLRSATLSTDAKRQNAADDMGAARSEHPYRHPRIRRRRKRWSLGYCTHH